MACRKRYCYAHTIFLLEMDPVICSLPYCHLPSKWKAHSKSLGGVLSKFPSPPSYPSSSAKACPAPSAPPIQVKCRNMWLSDQLEQWRAHQISPRGLPSFQQISRQGKWGCIGRRTLCHCPSPSPHSLVNFSSYLHSLLYVNMPDHLQKPHSVFPPTSEACRVVTQNKVSICVDWGTFFR